MVSFKGVLFGRFNSWQDWFLGSLFDFEDDLDNEFTNQLFEQLNSAYYFPNPKEGSSTFKIQILF